MPRRSSCPCWCSASSAPRSPTRSGISGVARLRPGYASLMGLGEVLCAVLAAWILLGEAITSSQAMGGAVVLLGLALAAREDRRHADVGAETSRPDAGPAQVHGELSVERLAFANRAM